jgi:hypothetical protein
MFRMLEGLLCRSHLAIALALAVLIYLLSFVCRLKSREMLANMANSSFTEDISSH